MGLLDKVKNLFTDEIIEEEDLPIKNSVVKEENQLPTFMREKIEKEEKPLVSENTSELVREIPKVEISSSDLDNIKEGNDIRDSKDEPSSFKFPVFEDNDFVETTRQSKQNILYQEQNKKKEEEKKKKPSEIYGTKKEKKEVTKFRATPIISPVYGILDKNYTKEEVKVNDYSNSIMEERDNKSNYKKSVMDFESVRKKAFGGVPSDSVDNSMCENCELYKEAKRQAYESFDDLSYENDYNVNNSDSITLEQASENYFDYGVSYEPVHKVDDDVMINNNVHDDSRAEQIEISEPLNSKPNVLSTLRKSMGDSDNISVPESRVEKKKSIEDLELTDDLFNLIDSMYEERNDD